jgi:hypothetical protein
VESFWPGVFARGLRHNIGTGLYSAPAKIPTSFARFGGARITFLVGSGVRHYGSLGMPVALTSIAFALGLLLIPFGDETRGKHLPSLLST